MPSWKLIKIHYFPTLSLNIFIFKNITEMSSFGGENISIWLPNPTVTWKTYIVTKSYALLKIDKNVFFPTLTLNIFILRNLTVVPSFGGVTISIWLPNPTVTWKTYIATQSYTLLKKNIFSNFDPYYFHFKKLYQNSVFWRWKYN